ncbi:2-keto-4-pentenoate hydratase [Paucibacter oligotrophus]|uniref:2-keto-4-pentenoate hydratase n=1 Tax=Roseateles oligotrophus TaxID=1769250 RepID=A0A840L8P5_9BURK|nr:fumarylacetoacetate hydrolase family protein [Roseateles oligotrophus]MBB4843133.1 2-keto-4-pentenoate hydratase [Roseateles oligotrophus]
MNNTKPQTLAAALAQAWTEGLLLPSGGWLAALNSSEDAYLTQDLLAHRLAWADVTTGQVRCWKSGGPSRSAELSHAPLAPTGVRMGKADFSDLQLRAPGVEAEIALRLGEEVSPARAASLGYEEASRLIEAYTVSAELVCSRWLEAGEAPPLLRQADCLSHGALALGDWIPWSATALPDWSRLDCWIQRNQEAPLRGQGGHPLQDPAWLLPGWLRHLSRKGMTVPAGTVVTTGAWLSWAELSPGDSVRLGFEGLGEIRLSL